MNLPFSCGYRILCLLSLFRNNYSPYHAVGEQVFSISFCSCCGTWEKNPVPSIFQSHQHILQIPAKAYLIFYWVKENQSFSAGASNRRWFCKNTYHKLSYNIKKNHLYIPKQLPMADSMLRFTIYVKLSVRELLYSLQYRCHTDFSNANHGHLHPEELQFLIHIPYISCK